MAMLGDTNDEPTNGHEAERRRKLKELQEQFEKGKKDRPEPESPYKSM